MITQVQATLINADQATSKGVDLELAYAFELAGWQANARVLATRIDELTLTNNGVTTDFVTQVGQTSAFGPSSGGPEWRINYALNLSRRRVATRRACALRRRRSAAGHLGRRRGYRRQQRR